MANYQKIKGTRDFYGDKSIKLAFIENVTRDVAIKYGWQSHSAFSKSFNREFGFSPSLLRAMKLEIDCIGGSYMYKIFLASTQVGMTKTRQCMSWQIKKTFTVLQFFLLEQISREKQ